MQQLTIGCAPGNFKGQIIDDNVLRASLGLRIKRTVSR
jgi:hypothetical protein